MARGKIGDYSRAKLISIIDERAGTSDTTRVAGSDNQIQFNNGGAFGAISAFTWDDTNLTITDDTKLIFGANSDAHIEYNENGDDFLIISGSSKGMVLSGTTVQIRGTLVGASPLQIAGGVEIVSLEGEAETSMKFGDDIQTSWGDEGTDDSFLQWKASGRSAGYMIISASTNGIVLSGSAVEIDQKLGIGMGGSNITHAITLPNSDTTAGKIKATAYTTYSSERYKQNIQPIQNPLEIVNNLKGVTFDWKKSHAPDIGFIAEQVGKHLPNIVDWEENGIDAQSMDYNKIVPILVEAIKNQQSQIDNLKDQIFSIISVLKAD